METVITLPRIISVHRAISDEGGNIIKAIAYDRYGNVLSDSNPAFNIPFGFAGGLQDGEGSDWTERRAEVYGYVGNDSVNMIDPNGTQPFIPSKNQVQGCSQYNGASSEAIQHGMNMCADACEKMNQYIEVMLGAAATVGTGLAGDAAIAYATPKIVRGRAQVVF